MNRPSAEILALEALSWVAETGALPDFLDHSGLEIGDLRERAGDSELHAALIDFLLSRDDLTKDFCDHNGIAPEEVWRARRQLPGGNEVA